MAETKTIWLCPVCTAKLNGKDAKSSIGQEPLSLIRSGELVTNGFRDPEDHHRDCDLRVSVSCGDHGYDCNVSCEQWDDCPFDCHGCGAEGGERHAATLWPAVDSAVV